MKFLHSLPEHAMFWLRQRLSNRQFLLLSGVLVGLSSATAAILLKTVVHYLRMLLTGDHGWPYQYLIYLCLPLTGLLLCGFFLSRFYRKGRFRMGVAGVMYYLHRHSGLMPGKDIFANLATSVLTMGFGGSAGLEAPIVASGAATGSKYAANYQLNYKERSLLIACGAAAGIAAVFNAPVAGVLFALEVILAEISLAAFIPIMLSAVSGVLLSSLWLQEDILLRFNNIHPFHYQNVPWYILLALGAGMLSLFYVRCTHFIDRHVLRYLPAKRSRVIAGGLVLALLIAFFPPLFGEGYESIKSLSKGAMQELFAHGLLERLIRYQQVALVFTGIILLLKVAAVRATMLGGGNGGNFAPSLFIGAYWGFLFARLVNLSGLASVPEINFITVGMASLLSALYHAPLTAIFLIAEITGGYELLIPLMLVSAITNAFTRRFEPIPMEVKHVAEELGMAEPRDIPLVPDFADKDAPLLETGKSDESVLAILQQAGFSIYPVVRPGMQYAGYVLWDDVRKHLEENDGTPFRLKAFIRTTPVTLYPTTNLEEALLEMDKFGLWYLPVCDHGTFKGFVSKTELLRYLRSEKKG